MKEYSFFEDVWDVVKLIPHGRVTNYGAIAKYLGTGMSSRMVGWAMNAIPKDGDIPAHRVVNRLGLLSGAAHFGGDRMKELLESEGIEIINNNQVKNFKTLVWNPATELDI